MWLRQLDIYSCIFKIGLFDTIVESATTILDDGSEYLLFQVLFYLTFSLIFKLTSYCPVSGLGMCVSCSSSFLYDQTNQQKV